MAGCYQLQAGKEAKMVQKSVEDIAIEESIVLEIEKAMGNM